MSAKGHISGGRLNSAVTIGALVGRQIPPRVAVPYCVSLLGDAVAGLVYAYVLHEKKPAAVKSANWTPSRESLKSSRCDIVAAAIRHIERKNAPASG